ncbi:uncharacterized protein [Temnothorax longispinosus]|uniref:uncharacterized protein n=1 Tax=Temnothorax longispinosus TaxID=300112 RepID=UPI003A991188
MVQRLQERFWKIWSSDYLNSLQQRKKWQTCQINLKIGDLVLLRNPSLPPTKWDIGRVLQCHTGDDDLVRVVTIKTARSTLKRPRRDRRDERRRTSDDEDTILDSQDKRIKEDLESHSRSVSSCLDQIRQVVLTSSNVLFSDEVSTLEKNGRFLRTRFDKALDRTDKLLKRLIGARNELTKFKNELTTYSIWLDKARSVLEEEERSLSDLNKLSSSTDTTHLRGRAHQLMMEKLDESYKLKVDLMMRHELRVAEEQRELSLNNSKRRGKKVSVDFNVREYCTMCDLNFYNLVYA